MNFKRLCAVLAFIFVSRSFSFAQPVTDPVIEQIIESIAENLTEEKDYSEITERLDFYSKNRLNLNTVTRDKLQDLLFMSPLQINNLLLHREESGLFLDLLEIQSIRGFDVPTARWLSHFVRIEPTDILTDLSPKDLLSKGNHDLMIRFGKVLEKQDGFLRSGSDAPAYAGSNLRIFTRYRYNHSNKLSVSLNMEKDAGEAFFKKKGRGFDFYSANVFLKGRRLIRKLVLGDYALQFGQGLTMWSGLGFGKGAGLTSLAKPEIGLRPYSSANEASFMRGVSATLQHRLIALTPFISYKDIDASRSESGLEINSLTISGLHRTSSERDNKDAISELVYGLNSQYERKALNLGLTVYKTQFSLAHAPGNSLYERYEFTGNSLVNLGAHYSYSYKNAYFFGELAHSFGSGSAVISGAIASLSKQVSFAVLYRNYARNYHSFFNQGISEATQAVNERGFYSGLVIKFNSKFELITYADFFRFPWLKFRVDAPSSGHELLAQLSYNMNKTFKISARFKQELKEENAEPQFNGGLDHSGRQNARVELNYKLSNSFSLSNRAEVSIYHQTGSSPEYGFLNYQDIVYDPLNSRLSGNVRFAIFGTPGFNSRIYAFENDVLYGYSIPAYQGRGLRSYANIRYTVQKGIDIWLRYALLNYSGQETVGSGYDQIKGNKRSDLKIQLRFQF